MDDTQPDRAMMIYHSFMTEVKVRLSAIFEMLNVIDQVAQSPHNFIIVEGCYLQIRMVCELIALGSVVVHQPHLETRAVLDLWNAGAIFKRLLATHARCFPEAVIQGELNGITHFDFPDLQPFTADDLIQCYNACGDALHRGKTKALLAGKVKNYDLAMIRHSANAIANLLHHHLILLGGEEAIMVHMDAGEGGAVLITRGLASNDPPD